MHNKYTNVNLKQLWAHFTLSSCKGATQSTPLIRMYIWSTSITLSIIDLLTIFSKSS